MSLPYLLVVILVMLVLGNSVPSLLVALCVTSWCNTARAVRGVILQLKSSEYVMAAQTLGASPQRIIIRHLLPNTMGILILNTATSIPNYIFQESTLSFLGIGLQPPDTSLGVIISLGQSVMEFYPTIGVQRDVGSRPDTDVYGLRGLTSCRWLFDPIPMGGNFGGADGQTPEMPGWTYYADQNGFHIWENQYYIPLGFSYDYYITREEYDAVTESNRHLLLLKAIVLSDEQAERYDGILQHADTLSLPETEEGGVPGLSDGTEPVSPSGGSDVVFTYTEEAYYQDCLDRRSMSCSSFSRDNGGFSAVFTSDRERLVFFSVPYESGWSATVNGEPAQVEKVNVGFMAVKVPAGTSEIRFDYSTPGLRFGAVVSAAGVLILILYLRLARRFDRAAKQNGQGGKQDDEANGLSGDSVL